MIAGRRHGALLRARGDGRPRRRPAAARPARRPAPTTPSASWAACSAWPCWRRSSPTRAATDRPIMFTDGIIPALWVGAAVVGVGALAASAPPGPRPPQTSASASPRFRGRTRHHANPSVEDLERSGWLSSPQDRCEAFGGFEGPARRPSTGVMSAPLCRARSIRSSAGSRSGQRPEPAGRALRTAVVVLAVDQQVLHQSADRAPCASWPGPSTAADRRRARADDPFDQRPLVPALCVVQRRPRAASRGRAGRDRRPSA